MYDRAELRPATRRFWAAIRAQAPDAPRHLSDPDDLWSFWRAPGLWMAQTCGLPYRARLHGAVTLVGTPDYGLAGCQPGYYRSVLVARGSDPRAGITDFAQARLAYNEALSQSGWAAPFFHARRHGFAFSDLLRTGAHSASARAVVTGAADLAALDAQSWRLMQRYEDWTADLQVIDHTDPTPGLPYITAQTALAPRIAEAVATAIEALSPEDRDSLGLKGLIRIPQEAYMALPLPDKPDEKLHKTASGR